MEKLLKEKQPNFSARFSTMETKSISHDSIEKLLKGMAILSLRNVEIRS